MKEEEAYLRRDRALKAHSAAAEWMGRYENRWVWKADMTGLRRWLADNLLAQIRNNEEPVAFVPDEIREMFKTFPTYGGPPPSTASQ